MTIGIFEGLGNHDDLLQSPVRNDVPDSDPAEATRPESGRTAEAEVQPKPVVTRRRRVFLAQLVMAEIVWIAGLVYLVVWLVHRF